MADDRDPAVEAWVEALANIRAVQAREQRPWQPDLRTPYEVAVDDALEAKAEARADHNSCDHEGLADEAADAWERHFEKGWE